MGHSWTKAEGLQEKGGSYYTFRKIMEERDNDEIQLGRSLCGSLFEANV